MIKGNWHVITGGPGSGKTTLINLLNKKGYMTVRETARDYIESQIKMGVSNEDLRRNPERLQTEIFNLQKSVEEQLDQNMLHFLDRALPDSVAYASFLKVKISSFKAREIKNKPYKNIFLLEQLPIVNDGIRTESEETARQISASIRGIYEKIGAHIITVPVMSIEKRALFVLDKI